MTKKQSARHRNQNSALVSFFYARLRFKKFIIICTRPLTGYLPAVFVRVYLIFTAFTDEKLL